MINLTNVIEQLLAAIPSGESTDNLKAELEDIYSSTLTASPEMMHFWWKETANILQCYIPTPKQNWEWKMVDIWAKTKEVKHEN